MQDSRFNLSLTECFLDTPSLSLMSNKSIFRDRKSSSTVKSVVFTFLFRPGYIACREIACREMHVMHVTPKASVKDAV